jgi:hypothetical protein
MSVIYLECKPDEKLVMKLGIARKKIEHKDGKSRVYAALMKTSHSIGIVDEDPHGPKYTYEKELALEEEKNGVYRYTDKKRGNSVLVLKVKLEDWLIAACKQNDIDIDITKSPYSLPGKGNDLHRVINDKNGRLRQTAKRSSRQQK